MGSEIAHILKNVKQDSISVECLPPASVATTKCQYQWEGGGLQVNKFEQVSSDDHQMSVAGVGPLQWWAPDVNSRGYPRSDVQGEGGTLLCDLLHDACDVTAPNRMTDTCENITFLQLRWRAVKIPELPAACNRLQSKFLTQTPIVCSGSYGVEAYTEIKTVSI